MFKSKTLIRMVMPIKLAIIVVIVFWAAPMAQGPKNSASNEPSRPLDKIAGLTQTGDFYLDPEEPAYLEFAGSALWREHINVKVSGDYAYLAMLNGLQILDVSDPVHPSLVANMYLPGNGFRDIVVQGEEVFLAGLGQEFHRVEVSDTYHPRVTGTFVVDGYLRGMAISGDFAYLTCSSPLPLLEPYTIVLDISGEDLAEIARYPFANSGFITSSAGNRAIAANDSLGFTLLDISDPYNLSVLGSTGFDGQWIPFMAEIEDTLAYISAYPALSIDKGQRFNESALLIYNIKDPENPVRVSTTTFDAEIYNCVVSGNLVYVSNSFWGVQILDVSDPAHPAIIGHYLNPGYLLFIDVVDTVLYACDNWPWYGTTNMDPAYWGGASPGDFLVVNVVDSTNPQIMGYYHVPAQVSKIVSDQQHVAFCLNDYDSLGADIQIVDLSDPVAPQEIGSYSTDRGAGIGGCAAGEFFYLATGPGGLEIVDMTSKSAPVMVGACEGGAGAQDVIVDNDYAFVANGTSGLWIWDVADPENPKFVNSLPVTGAAESIVESGGYAYVAGGGLHVFDISDPENANAGAALAEYADCHALTIGDGRLYAQTSSGFVIFDILTDPAHPALMNQVSIGVTPNGLAYYDGFITLTCGSAGIIVYNIEDPDNPDQVGTFDTPGASTGIAIDSGVVYIADTKSLIIAKFPMILDADDDAPQTPEFYSLRQNYPNPFNPETTIEYVVSKRSTVTLTVFNILGQSVRTLVNDTKPAGAYIARWDGRDSRGNQLASGTYLYRIDMGGYSETRKMVLLK